MERMRNCLQWQRWHHATRTQYITWSVLPFDKREPFLPSFHHVNIPHFHKFFLSIVDIRKLVDHLKKTELKWITKRYYKRSVVCLKGGNKGSRPRYERGVATSGGGGVPTCCVLIRSHSGSFHLRCRTPSHQVSLEDKCWNGNTL